MNRRREIENKKKNYCCSFILPMVGVNYKNLPTNFINAYITSDYGINMVFDKTEDYDVIFYHYVDNLKTKNVYLNNHLEEEDEVILKFNIPKLYHEEFELFKIGKYSQFDNNYKKLLVSYFGQKSMKDSHLVYEYNVIYPQDFKRQQIAERLYDSRDLKEGLKFITEVLDTPDLNKEIFKTIDELLQLNINNQLLDNYEQSQQSVIGNNNIQ